MDNYKSLYLKEVRELRVAQQAGEDWAEEGGMHIFKVVTVVFASSVKYLQGGQGGWQENDGESIHGQGHAPS